MADFSFSVYSPQKLRETQCGSVVYSSPEVISGESYDNKIDVWALGVLAFELCNGETPWEDLDKKHA
jgi:aurora kinase A